MTPYRIEITPDALRALAKLDKPIRRRVQSAIDRLQHNPRPAGVIALRGMPGAYRIRVSSYRVIYTITDDQLLITIIDLGHRSKVYRR